MSITPTLMLIIMQLLRCSPRLEAWSKDGEVIKNCEGNCYGMVVLGLSKPGMAFALRANSPRK